MKRYLSTVALSLVALGANAETTKPDLAKAEQIVTNVCAACHGAKGMSLAPTNPHLAGQHRAYIVKQLANFKGGVRQNAIMGGMAAMLTPEDMVSVAAYFAQQTPPPPAGSNAELAKVGEAIYRYGNASKGLPSCTGCHGPNGQGIPDQYPRLAGQYADYAYSQLKAFSAYERNHIMMNGVASRLTDSEMKAVAEYLAGLK
ncbi:MAG: c-type cytochrome [Burkholderiales bacterium]|jgi:cytochrome c553|nr:cytochrome c4 [Betaproteobacteria bacterium]